jgi:hypothetical protein
VTVSLGQRTTGDIEGTVKDPQGAVVPNVTITVVSVQGGNQAGSTSGNDTTVTSGFRRTVQSNDEGFFRVQQVPPGSYTVTTTAVSGFGEARYDNVRVALDTTTPLEIQLTVGTQANIVDVSVDDAPPIDVGGTKIQTSVTSQRIELLPKGVDFTSVLRTAPGTRGESLAGGFSVDGASGSENAFYIDGQEVTNFRTGTLNGNNAIPTQFVQEVQIKSSGFEAEFGGATGGVISVVTKGGSNDFRGEFGLQFGTPKLNGGNRPSLLRFTSGTGSTFAQTTEYFRSPKSDGTNVFTTASLSGPVIKDRLWFFTSYSPQVYVTENQTTFFSNAPAATRTITGSDRFRIKQTREYAFARLDASVTNNLRLSGTYLWNPIVEQGALPFGPVSIGGNPAQTTDFGGSIGTLVGSQLTDRQGGRQNSNNVTAQAVYTPTSNLVFSGRFSRGFLNEKLNSYFVPLGTRFVCQSGSAGTTTYPGACSTGFVDPVNTNVVKDVSIRTNYEVDASYLVSDFGGRHEFKGGYQRFKIFNDVERGYIGPGRVDLYYGVSIADLGAPVIPTRPICSQVQIASGQTSGCALGSGEVIRFGTKGQGQNLNQSIYIQDRWQPFSRLTLNLGVRAEKEDLPSFNGLAPPINFGYGDKISPRLGFALDPFGNGRTKIFASYGRFFDRLKFELPRGSFGGDFYRVDFFEILPGGGDFRSYTVARVLGNFNDAPGGACPSTGFIGSGISRCQFDYRIASNDPNATLETGTVDPNLKPFRQTEFTGGVEHQLSNDFVIRGRYTRKVVDSAIEDAGIINATGSEAYIIGNPGSGLHRQLLEQQGYTNIAEPVRRYNAFEVTLDKRLSNNFYFNANYTYSRLVGNYSGLASSDENGRTSPGVNRFFDLPFIGFTAAGKPDIGRLATDRPHVFNAYGAYIFDWFGSKTNSTDLGFFTTAQSGTPQTTLINFLTSTIFTERGDLGRTETFTQTDFNFSHKYRFGRDNRFTIAADLNILNAFDEENVTGLYSLATGPGISLNIGSFRNATTNALIYPDYVSLINAYTTGALLPRINGLLAGDPVGTSTTRVLNRADARYGQPSSFQGPRSVRFGFRFLF